MAKEFALVLVVAPHNNLQAGILLEISLTPLGRLPSLSIAGDLVFPGSVFELDSREEVVDGRVGVTNNI